MATAEDNDNFDYEYTESRLEEVQGRINSLNANAKWQLGLLAAFALGLASFTFRDLGELPIIHESLDNATLFIKLFSGALLILYSVFILLFIPLLLWGMEADDESEDSATLSKTQKIEKLKDKLKECRKELFIMKKRFKRLIISSISSPFVAAVFATCFTYFA